MGRWYLGIGETLWITLCTTRLVIGAILGEIGGALYAATASMQEAQPSCSRGVHGGDTNDKAARGRLC